ncbi:MAG: hypothetical protein ABI718_11160 [Acidobacteriota bacterium]
MKIASLTAALILVIGCSSTAPDRSAKAASSLEAVQKNSARARTEIDAVLSSLDTLLNAPADKLRDSYDRYADHVKKMNDYAQAIRENDADFKANGDEYLNQWKKTASGVSDPELRAIAQQRQNEVADKGRNVRMMISGASQSFAGFLKDIGDIRKVIGNDLTPTGQDSVRNTSLAQSVQQEGADVKDALRRAEQSVSDLRSEITPTGK